MLITDDLPFFFFFPLVCFKFPKGLKCCDQMVLAAEQPAIFSVRKQAPTSKFGRQISTFCQANTLKTECLVQWIAERETTGLALCSMDCRERNNRPCLVISARNIVSKCSFCVQI